MRAAARNSLQVWSECKGTKSECGKAERWMKVCKTYVGLGLELCTQSSLFTVRGGRGPNRQTTVCLFKLIKAGPREWMHERSWRQNAIGVGAHGWATCSGPFPTVHALLFNRPILQPAPDTCSPKLEGKSHPHSLKGLSGSDHLYIQWQGGNCVPTERWWRRRGQSQTAGRRAGGRVDCTENFTGVPEQQSVEGVL